MRFHADERPSYKCPFCDSSIAGIKKFLAHVRNVKAHAAVVLQLSDDELAAALGMDVITAARLKKDCADRKFKCDNCNYSENCQIHRAIHVGAKTYMCPFCSKTFAHKCGLITHVSRFKRHTSDVNRMPANVLAQLLNVRLHAAESIKYSCAAREPEKYICTKCNFKTSVRRRWNSHAGLHGGATSFKVPHTEVSQDQMMHMDQMHTEGKSQAAPGEISRSSLGQHVVSSIPPNEGDGNEEEASGPDSQ